MNTIIGITIAWSVCLVEIIHPWNNVMVIRIRSTIVYATVYMLYVYIYIYIYIFTSRTRPDFVLFFIIFLSYNLLIIAIPDFALLIFTKIKINTKLNSKCILLRVIRFKDLFVTY